VQPGVSVPDIGLPAPDGRVIVFGGPGGNLPAAQALLAEAERLGVPTGRMFRAGDPRPTRDSGADAAAALLRAAGVGMYGDRPFRFRLGRRRLAIPGSAAVPAPLYGSTPWHDKAPVLDRLGTDGVVAASSGLPFTQIGGGRLWFDPGSLAVPADDGTPQVWFGLLTPVDGGIRIEQRPLAYDHGSAAEAARRAGRPEAEARALETGLWPDLDGVPEAERGAAGHRIGPRRVFWADPAP